MQPNTMASSIYVVFSQTAENGTILSAEVDLLSAAREAYECWD